MSSRREEERNEKIIRGLMKLPPNRRCINCNSLGPQYVCTNFWTFICITCSGIHREFTHRVKSVSMAKFTSQEVEALENGGNQRARDIFLKDWDMQRQRLPDSSNADKIRDFIKSVYVDKKYTGGKSSEKPPRDMQGHKTHEEDTRRASSYHSYSQSPPYDHQYEDRRYGKQTGMLTRKPGSDRVHNDGKFSSFVYSPGHMAGQMFEDRFANEGSAPRFSKYSVSSAGDTSRHDGQSPNYQKDSGYSSPPAMQVRNILIEDGRHQTLNTFLEADAKGEPRDVDRIQHSQRATSSGSFGSFDSNSPSLKSVNSANLIDVTERDQSTGTQLPEASLPSSSQQVYVNANAADQNLLGLPLTQFSANSSPPSIDLFAEISNPLSSTSSLAEASLPSVSPQLPLNAYAADQNLFGLPLPQSLTHSSAPSIDLFAEINNPLPSNSSFDQKLVAVPILEKEGWATFDMPHHAASTSETQSVPLSAKSIGDVIPTSTFDAFSSNNNLKWDSVQSSVAREPVVLVADQWNMASREPSASSILSNSQSWNAFDDFNGNTAQTEFGNPVLEVLPQIPVSKPPESVDSITGTNISEGSSKNELLGITGEGGASEPLMPFGDNKAVPLFSSPTPMMGENIPKRKSYNPFDFPYESDLEPCNMFLDMSSLKAALPNLQFPTAFPTGITQPWFPQNANPPYISSVPSGGLPYIGPPSSQLPNLASQGPVASGNPFA